MTSAPPPPDLIDNIDSIQNVLSADRIGLITDFDGTISEMAAIPDEAVAYPGILETLGSLADKLALVSIISGRAAPDVMSKANVPGVVYVGNHGAERIVNGKVMNDPEAEAYRSAINEAHGELRRVVDYSGMFWENKGLSASAHYRLTSDPAAVERHLHEATQSISAISGLEVFWGRFVMELRSPTGVNKGHALRKLIEEWRLDSVVFLGDDTTDGDAMIALADIKAESPEKVIGANVVVIHADTPEFMLRAADFSLQSVGHVAEFFKLWDDRIT